jgi:O-antigen/teichoic acid export membrane protein
MSQAVRAVAGMVVFTLLLLVTHNLVVACLGMALVALASFVLLTIPLTLLETPKSRGVDLLEVKELFVECFPAFAAQFLFALIETMPKFAMEGVLPYESQVYFNAIYFPAQTILMIVGFVYKPQLVRIANVWADRSKRARFDVIVFAMLGVSLAVTLVMLFVFGAVGVWLNGLMYGVDFEPYRTAQYLMIVAGGLSAAIDFLYQIITVLRQQAAATVVYLIAFVVVLVLSMVLVRMVGFDGAVYSYLVVMVALFAMLAVQYALVRLRANR